MVSENGNKKILSFGELLLRICPDANGNWLKNNTFPFYVGGAEANVATALATWNVPSAYITAIPDNELSGQLVQYLNEKNIDTSKITYQGGRLGIFYLHQGKDMKNAGVIYDRNHSSFSQLQIRDIDWERVFEDVSWFHFSAICPAINQNVVDVCLKALKVALQKNIIISLDLNYRSKLWQYGKQPIEIMPELANYCDLIMGNIWAAEKMLGIIIGKKINSQSHKEEYLEQAEKSSKAVLKAFPKAQVVANTFRFDHKEQGIKYYTTLYANDCSFVSKEYFAEKITDKVGSGDCFMAGLIYGFYNKIPEQEIVDFATAAAYQKLFEEGDATKQTVENIKNFIKDDK